MKKIFKNLVLTATVITPLVAAVSCGGSGQAKAIASNPDAPQSPTTTNQGNEPTNVQAVNIQSDAAFVKTNLPQPIPRDYGQGLFNNFEQSALTEGKIATENNVRRVVGTPFAEHFHFPDVAIWNKEKDVDLKFNATNYPIANRGFGYKTISTQTENRVDWLINLQKDTAGTPSNTISKDSESNGVFDQWQTVSSVTTWGGSQSEGLVILPKAQDTIAAHRNGAKINGTIFFPSNQNGGNPDFYRQMVQKQNGKYIIADKLLEMTKTYGFDGWTLNMETTMNDQGLISELGNFINYFHSELNKNGFSLQLYSFGIGSQFYSQNNYDLALLDFSHRSYRPVKDLVTDRSKQSAGWDMDKGFGSNTDEGGPWPFNGENLWIYTYFRHVRNFLNDSEGMRMITGSSGQRDPRIEDTDNFVELAKVYKERTVINSRKPFATNFELGWGTKFFREGKEIPLHGASSDDGWKNSGEQDVLPSYKYITDYYDVDSWNTPLNRNGDKVTPITVDGTKWTVEVKNTDKAWNGASSLNYQGKLGAHKAIVNKLYASNIPLKANDHFTTIIEGNDSLNLAVWNEDHMTIVKDKQIEQLGNGFSKITYTIPQSLDGVQMTSFGLEIENNLAATQDVNLNIGYLSMDILQNPTPVKITNVRNDGKFYIQRKTNNRLSWDIEDPEHIVHHYAIYSANNNFEKQNLYDLTALPASLLKEVGPRDANHIPVVIEAYDATGKIVASQNVLVENT